MYEMLFVAGSVVWTSICHLGYWTHLEYLLGQYVPVYTWYTGKFQHFGDEEKREKWKGRWRKEEEREKKRKRRRREEEEKKHT